VRVAPPRVDGDHVRLTGLRNFDYRSRNDFTVRYEEREVLLSRLMGLDFYVSYPHPCGEVISDGRPSLQVDDRDIQPLHRPRAGYTR
jgi:hypothetical protein